MMSAFTGSNSKISMAVYSTKKMRSRSKQSRWVNVRVVIGWIEQAGVNKKLWSKQQ